MYEDYPSIEIEALALLAQGDIARGVSKGRYLICLKFNEDSIYIKSSLLDAVFWQLLAATENIDIAAIVIDYQAALESNQKSNLLVTLEMLRDINGLHQERTLPAFICLDVFNPP